MTDQGTLERQISRGLEHLEALRLRSEEGFCAADRPVVERLLAELATALAELSVTAEELQQRNDDLVAAHQALIAANLEAEENFASAPLAYLITDSAGKIARANHAAVELLRMRPSQAEGKLILPRIHPEDRQTFLHGLSGVVSSNRAATWSGRVAIVDDEVPVAFSAFPVSDPDGKVLTVRWTLRDLSTELVDAAEGRRLHALAALGEMSATVAHQLRNPLAGVRGMLQVMRSRSTEPSAHQMLDEALAATARLDETVRSLLDFARPWKSTSNGCDPRQVADEVAVDRAILLDVRKIVIHVTGPHCHAGLDAPFLRQIIAELVDNAATAMVAPGAIEIEIERGKDAVIARVRDHGRGMTPETMRRAFEPFFTTSTRGTGLGLPICRRIAEAHGGRIEATSVAAGGTLLTVSFPVAEA